MTSLPSSNYQYHDQMYEPNHPKIHSWPLWLGHKRPCLDYLPPARKNQLGRYCGCDAVGVQTRKTMLHGIMTWSHARIKSTLVLILENKRSCERHQVNFERSCCSNEAAQRAKQLQQLRPSQSHIQTCSCTMVGIKLHRINSLSQIKTCSCPLRWSTLLENANYFSLD